MMLSSQLGFGSESRHLFPRKLRSKMEAGRSWKSQRRRKYHRCHHKQQRHSSSNNNNSSNNNSSSNNSSNKEIAKIACIMLSDLIDSVGVNNTQYSASFMFNRLIARMLTSRWLCVCVCVVCLCCLFVLFVWCCLFVLLVCVVCFVLFCFVLFVKFRLNSTLY